jgi:hypothetical protein
VRRGAVRNGAVRSGALVAAAATGLVRSLVVTYFKAGYHVSVRLSFTGFGAEPAALAPPSTQVGDLGSVLKQFGF